MLKTVIKSSLIILASCGLLLTSCDEPSTTTSTSQTAEEVTLDITINGYGSFVPVKDTYVVGETIAFYVTPGEGYYLSSVLVNNERIKEVAGAYSFVAEENYYKVEATFTLIELSENEMTFEIIDEAAKKAKLISYNPYDDDLIPTPLIIPDQVSINGSTYYVTAIGERAFYDIYLTKIQIGQYVDDIACKAFSSLISLKSIEVSTNNPTYTSIDGSLYSKDENSLIYVPMATTESEYHLRAGVETIYDYCFHDNQNIDTIVFNDNINLIGQGAFEESSLSAIILPGNVILSDNAFKGCIYLKNVSFEEGLINIPESCFYSCTAINKLSFPTSLKNIETFAFYSCSGLAQINFNEGLVTIGYGAFALCRGTLLTSLVFPSTLKTISSNAFSTCYGVLSITFNSGLEEIGDYCFSGLSYLREITPLPASLEKIGHNPFYGVADLAKILVDENNPYYFCEESSGALYTKDTYQLISMPYYNNVESYSLPEGATAIGDSAFAHTRISQIVLPITIEKIGTTIFESYEAASIELIYEGTIEQFAAIEKASSWALNGESYVFTSVTCQDGLYEL